MKKTSKLLSILLAVLMVFSAIPISSSASAIPSGITKLDQLIQKDSLANLADWLVTALNNRKTNIMGTVLTYVDAFVPAINEKVPEGTDLFNGGVSAEQKATYLLNYLDALLAEKDLNSSLDLPDALTSIVTIDLNSVNGIFATLCQLEKVSGALGLLGDLKDLNLGSVVDGSGVFADAQSRSDGDLQLLYNLIGFIKDNLSIIKKFINGNLKLGVLSSMEGDVNGLTADLPATLENLVYNNLLKEEGNKADSALYKDCSIDQLLVIALVRLINKTVAPETAIAISADALDTTVYGLFTKYGDQLVNKFLLPLLNQTEAADGKKGFADVLYDISHNGSEANDLAAVFNTSFSFAENEFDLAHATNGILGSLNDIVVKVLKKVVKTDVYNSLGIVAGDNTHLMANLTTLFKYVLPMMGSVDLGEFQESFKKYTADYVADMNLDELVVDILKIFFPGWFHLTAEEVASVADAETMPELAASAVYYAFVKFVPDMFTGEYDYAAEYKTLFFDANGKYLQKTADAWTDVILTMAADAAIYALNLNSATTKFIFTPAQVVNAKANKWTAEAFLDDIVDWALNMVKGLPAVADSLHFVRGQYDGYGPYYKVSVLLNEIFDLSLFNNCTFGSFNFDWEVFLKEGILGNFYKFDLSGVVGLLASNSKPANYCNMKAVPALVAVVDDVLTALFEHVQPGIKNGTIPATCTEGGCDVHYCTKCGLYTSAPDNKTEALGHNYKEVSLAPATCTSTGINRGTCDRCGDSYTVVAPKSSHIPSSKVFEEDGKLYFGDVCATCGEQLGKPVLLGEAPTSIEITTKPTTLTYTLGAEGTLDTTGIEVYARYDDAENDEVILLTDLEFTGFSTAVAGKVTITVSYAGLTDSFEIEVADTAKQYLMGDVDNDGFLTAADARTILRNSVSLDVLTGDALFVADVDDDGVVSAADARSALRMSVNLDPLIKKSK